MIRAIPGTKLIPGAVKRGLVHLYVVGSETALNAIGVPPAQALLLMGHMRSGSTLLLHLLLTNPEIGGVGERNATYRSAIDLGRLVMTARLAGRAPLARLRYVVDQINHSKFTPDPTLFENPRVRIIFLLRRPQATIASLLELMRTHYQPWSVDQAVDYYVERLQTLAGYGDRLRQQEHAALVTYDDLTDDPPDVLTQLQSFLGTSAGFSERYGVHEFTGKRGDPGPHITSGQIGRPSSHTDVTLPPNRWRARSRPLRAMSIRPVTVCAGSDPQPRQARLAWA